ncbi:hypothetical protein QQZ08_012199 [Neonectria magnoliae]|uniref:Uncharacterized protein n=1 Tax=Neonectria magnoliae TaxID=2732573 RepID=A0ABR1H4D1_9HYPO
MSRGPLPSRLHLLSNLPSRPVGEKVRFLGWYGNPSTWFSGLGLEHSMLIDSWQILTGRSVTFYSTVSGYLSLGHLYPRGTNVTVVVDVNLILESLTSEKTRIGEHVNVIGYITSKRPPHGQDTPHREAPQVSVQAVMLWSTGPMDIHTYERSFDAGTIS